MKKCNSCEKTFETEGSFCPLCGSPLVEETVEPKINSFYYGTTPESTVAEPVASQTEEKLFCPRCGTQLPSADALFCSKCGCNINAPSAVAAVAAKVKDNDFIKSVKSDLGNSQSINMLKEKVSTAPTAKKKKGKIIGIAAAVIIVILIIVTNIHTCEECDKTFFGKKYSIYFFNTHEDVVCKDCYKDFYTWN